TIPCSGGSERARFRSEGRWIDARRGAPEANPFQRGVLRATKCAERRGPGCTFSASDSRLPTPGMAAATLLVIDDEPQIRRAVRHALGGAEMRVVEAGTAREGID